MEYSQNVYSTFWLVCNRAIHHHPSHDWIPDDRKWEYAMELKSNGYLPVGLYFEFFNYALPYLGIEHFNSKDSLPVYYVVILLMFIYSIQNLKVSRKTANSEWCYIWTLVPKRNHLKFLTLHPPSSLATKRILEPTSLDEAIIKMCFKMILFNRKRKIWSWLISSVYRTYNQFPYGSNYWLADTRSNHQDWINIHLSFTPNRIVVYLIFNFCTSFSIFVLSTVPPFARKASIWQQYEWKRYLTVWV